MNFNWKRNRIIFIFITIILIVLNSINISYDNKINFTVNILSIILLTPLILFVEKLNKSLSLKYKSKNLKILEYISYVTLSLSGIIIIGSLLVSFLLILSEGGENLLIYKSLLEFFIFLIFIIFSIYFFRTRKNVLGKYNAENIKQDNYLIKTNFSSTEERLKLCKICLNRQIDFNQGLQCKLTNQKPDFVSSCEKFTIDKKEKEKIEKLSFDFEKNKKGFINSWKGALLFSLFGFVRAAIKGPEDPMGLVFILLGVGWLLITLFDKRD